MKSGSVGLWLGSACLAVNLGCRPAESETPANKSDGGRGSATASAGGTDSGGRGGSAGSTPSTPTWGIEARPIGQTCKPPASRTAAATLLSQTGCVDPTNPKEPAPTLIPYTVASPLWSDNAVKRRFVALPDSGKIRVKDCTLTPALCGPAASGGTYESEGYLELPDGSVLVKTFEVGGKMVETRLLVRVNKDNWWGYSYQWNDAQTDAMLLDSNTDGYEKTVAGPNGDQTWHFPSRQQCLQCHTAAAGVSLGLELAQLNVDFKYPNGATSNQVATWERIGIFEVTPRQVTPYPAPSDGAQPLETRARSYLHANCANCHRAGTAAPDFVATFETSLKDMQICNVAPQKGDLGVAGAMRLLPGSPEKSVLSLRMHALGAMTRMPQIGTRVVDPVGVDVVDAWIRSVAACP